MKMTLKLTQRLCIAFLLAGLFIACSDDDDGMTTNPDMGNSIADFVDNNADYSILDEALDITDLEDALDADGSMTVFAPNNAAFEAYLSANNYNSLSDVPVDALRQVLLNHVLEGEIASTSLSTGYESTLATEASTQANLSLLVEVGDNVVLNGNSTVTQADIDADNGIIHAVSAVINLPTVATFAANDDALSTLLTALTDDGNTTDFVSIASDMDADLTVFAPTNDAFATFLSDNNVSLEDVSGPMLDNILRNHILLGSVATSGSLSTMYTNTAATFNGTNDNLSLYINTDDGVMLNGTSSVSMPDIIATNGVIHVVDAVIGLPDITTFATADPNFSILVDALTREASFTYVSTLQTEAGTSPAPFTVFAPTNDAFGDLLAELGVASLADIDAATLEATLNMHVIANANVRAADLTDGMVSTLGEDITIDTSGPSIVDPNGRTSNIIATDVQASNGVIHAIDMVILPQQ